MASIQKRSTASGERWRVSFRIDKQLTSDTFIDPRAAADYAALVERIGGVSARAVLEARRDKAPGVSILSAFLSAYLAQLTGIEEGTRAEYARMAARSWLPDLGEMPVAAIKREQITAWVNSAAASGLAGKTIKNQHNLLSSVMKYAVKQGQRLDNPCLDIRLPRTVPAQPVFLSESEFSTLYSLIPERWKLLVAMLAGTGMRWGEVTALRWPDLDLDAAIPVVHISRAHKRAAHGARVESTTKTKRSLRTVSLPSRLAADLRAAKVPGDGFVFTGVKGAVVSHQNFYSRVWQPTVEAVNDEKTLAPLGLHSIGKKPRVHDLRHSHASWLIAAGLPLPVIQRRLGHESITTTVDRYGHLAGGALLQAAEAADDALALAMPLFVRSEIES
jgi:integrase